MPPRGPLPQIDAWLADRLKSSALDSHFEASVYGPLNGFLNIFFPISQHFLVKPQGLLRDSIIASGSDDQAAENPADFLEMLDGVNADANTSFDSYHDPVSHSGGLEGVRIPDFVIAKAGLGGVPDMVLAVVEVKNTTADQVLAVRQLCDYLVTAYRKYATPTLPGFLICGTKVDIYEINAAQFKLQQQKFATWKPTYRWKTNERRFEQYIHRIAAENW